MSTRVVHIRDEVPGAVRIDRFTRWGNPFKIDSQNTRDDVIRKFANWVVNDSSERARWIRAHVHELKGQTLACWCAPRACHGDVLAAMAEEGDV